MIDRATRGAPRRGEPILELAGRFVGPDRGAGEGDHAAGVDLGGHPDDGHARFGLAVLDRSRHGAAPR